MPAYRDKRDGRWRYRKWVALPNGTRTRITGTPATDTKVAAESAERAHIDRVLHPERARAADATAPKRKETTTFAEYAATFKRLYGTQHKPSARHAREQILDGSLIPFFGHMQLDGILQEHVDRFVAEQRVEPKTINNRLGVLSTVLEYAHENRLIPKPELRCHVDYVDAEIVAVPTADVRKLVDTATDDRYRVAVLLAAEAGLRIGEIRGLQWPDVKDGRITIRRAVDTRNNVGPPKHNKRRMVGLSPALTSALASLPRRGLWVVSRLDGEMIGYWAMLDALHDLYTRAGVQVPASETGATMPWHSLRHAFGSELAARGVPLPQIQKLMGHESIETTMRYVTTTEEQLDDAISRAFGRQAGNESTART